MVAINGEDYVFVRKPDGSAPTAPTSSSGGRSRSAQENADHVVVPSGLKPGEEVVTNGSLILSQLYEDRRTVDTGLPMQ